MKKALLLSGLLAGVLSAGAFEEPTIYADASFQCISPNGRWAASSLDGSVTIYNLETGVKYEYTQDETGLTYYTEGLGNYISNDGVVLGGTTSNSDAAYWQNGEWHQLNVVNPNNSNLSNGITPDGSRICGSVGLNPVSTDGDNLMLTPAYWDRNTDGTYGECHLLPCPELDFTGRVPQYITAISISEDGKTIAGQIQDCNGGIITPIVYIEGEDGEWSYKTLCEDLINPDHVEFPEYPGEGPAAPSQESFMTEDELAAYNEAVNKYYETFEGDYPLMDDYMTPEELAAYNEAMDAFKVVYEEWNARYEAFMELYYKILENAPLFVFNNALITPDGSKYFITNQTEDWSDPTAWMPSTINTPCSINIADGVLTKYDFGKSLGVCNVPNNDTFFVFNGVGALPMEGYIVKDGECTPIKDWLGAFSPELKTWIDDNMVHEIEVGYDWENDEFITEECYVTGMVVGSADLKTVAVWNDCPWGFDDTCGYVFNLGQYSGVKDSVVAAGSSVAFDAAGNLKVAGEVTALHVYDLAGRCVLRAAAPAGTLQCNLPAGVYLVKADTPAGTVTAKIAK